MGTLIPRFQLTLVSLVVACSVPANAMGERTLSRRPQAAQVQGAPPAATKSADGSGQPAAAQSAPQNPPAATKSAAGSGQATAAQSAQQPAKPGGGSSSGAATPASAPPPTVINLTQNAMNTVQLGFSVNGQFSFPPIFTADPSPTNGISISSMGEVSGTPTSVGDQDIKISIQDQAGKSIASYEIVLRVGGPARVVMLGGGSSPTDAGNNSPQPGA